jgi:hypothetical protein
MSHSGGAQVNESEGKTIYTGNDVVAEAIAASKKAGELTKAAIEQLLAEREEIERSLAALGYTASAANSHNGKHATVTAKTHTSVPVGSGSRKPFRDMKLANIGWIVLTEHKTLHGKKIEEMAKAGGYKGKAEKFQNYLAVALKRDGRFENTGRNMWKLKEGVAK